MAGVKSSLCILVQKLYIINSDELKNFRFELKYIFRIDFFMHKNNIFAKFNIKKLSLRGQK